VASTTVLRVAGATAGASAFGLNIRSHPGLPGLGPPAADGVDLLLADPAEVQARFSGGTGGPAWATVFGDGCTYAMEQGVAGDHLCTYGDRATFHIDAAREVVRCAPADPDGLAWQRFALDTILWSVSALHEHLMLHAGAVLVEGAVVAVTAGSGSGKSTLVAELVRRGHPLVTDDVLTCLRDRDGWMGMPGPAVMNVPLDTSGHAVDQLGRLLGVFEDPAPEAWIELEGARPAPAPIGAVVLLDRTAASPALEAWEPGILDLFGTTIGLPHLEGWQVRQLSGLAELVGSTSFLRLRVPATSSPGDTAQLLLDGLR
jgi:hypothetical protein